MEKKIVSIGLRIEEDLLKLIDSAGKKKQKQQLATKYIRSEWIRVVFQEWLIANKDKQEEQGLVSPTVIKKSANSEKR